MFTVTTDAKRGTVDPAISATLERHARYVLEIPLPASHATNFASGVGVHFS